MRAEPVIPGVIIAAQKAATSAMSVTIKTPEEVEKMRVAGRLAAEVLDFIAPHVRPNVTTDELDTLCHDYMVNVQKTVPAPLNYAPPGYQPYPKSICTSVNHVVCHGVPGPKKLKAGDVINIDVTLFQGNRRMYFHVAACRRFSTQSRHSYRTQRSHIWELPTESMSW